MVKTKRSPSEHHMPHELTAPAIQRLARKGIEEDLTEGERTELCECIVFHIETILKGRRIPKALKPR